MKKHYVTFLCPGSLFDETQSRPIDKWSPADALAIAETITERYGAKPYAFYFTTNDERESIVDVHGTSHEVVKLLATSGKHFIDGTVITREEVDKKAQPIMHSNMGNDGHEVVCRTQRSYTHHGVFAVEDCTVNARGEVVERGDSPRLVAYRAKVKAERDADNAKWEREYQRRKAAQ